MREKISIMVCVLTIAAVVVLSLHFARTHNPAATPLDSPIPLTDSSAPPAVTPSPEAPPSADLAHSPDPSPRSQPSPALVERGREIYGQQNCAACHAIAGEGNEGAPLDGIGLRLDAAEMEAWITGTGTAAAELLPGTIRRKARYRSLPRDDLDALVTYLLTVR